MRDQDALPFRKAVTTIGGRSTNDADTRLAVVRWWVVVGGYLNVELVLHLNDASDVAGQRMQQLTLVKRGHDAGESDHAAAGEDRQFCAPGELALLNEEGDAVLQITIGAGQGGSR